MSKRKGKNSAPSAGDEISVWSHLRCASLQVRDCPGSYTFKQFLEIATKPETFFEAPGREKGTQYTPKKAYSCTLSTKSIKILLSPSPHKLFTSRAQK